ncbi:MAG: tetratricopeptide repeat protein, partial [Proteobacteria bacterium]
GRYEEACEQASNALQEFPNSLALLNLLGKCLLKLGRYKVALKCFSRAQNISPNNVERLCRIAETKHFMKDDAGSESTLAKADELDPGNPLVQETKANIALGSGEVRKASELMAKLESLRGVLAFMNNRAIALTRAGQFDDGIALYRNTIVALPGDWGSLHDSVAYNLGDAGICAATSSSMQMKAQALRRTLCSRRCPSFKSGWNRTTIRSRPPSSRTKTLRNDLSPPIEKAFDSGGNRRLFSYND